MLSSSVSLWVGVVFVLIGAMKCMAYFTDVRPREGRKDARIIVSYLASQMAPKGPAAAVNLEVARALVDQRCGRCHNLDRVYKTAETPEKWSAVVTRMASYAAGSPGPQARRRSTDHRLPVANANAGGPQSAEGSGSRSRFRRPQHRAAKSPTGSRTAVGPRSV